MDFLFVLKIELPLITLFIVLEIIIALRIFFIHFHTMLKKYLVLLLMHKFIDAAIIIDIKSLPDRLDALIILSE